METTIATINQHKENYFSFDMNVDGLSVEDADVRFVVKYKPGFSLVFSCEHESGSTWRADLPSVPILERTTYNFVIEVVIDGYYFEAFRGLLNVVGAPDVYISKPKTVDTKMQPKQKRSKAFEKIQQPGSGDRTKGREKGIAQIAREQMEKNKAKSPIKETSNTEPKKSSVDIDKVVENVTKQIDSKKNPGTSKETPSLPPLDVKPVKESKAEDKKTTKPTEPKKIVLNKDKKVLEAVAATKVVEPKPAPKKKVIAKKVEPLKETKPEVAKKDDAVKKLLEDNTKTSAKKKAAPKKPVAKKKATVATKKAVVEKKETKSAPKIVVDTKKSDKAKQILKEAAEKDEHNKKAETPQRKKLVIKKGDQVTK